mgnify:CR=1 FL=1
MFDSVMDRRGFLRLGVTTGALALAASTMTKFSWADVRQVTLSECMAMSPEEMAKKSKRVMDSWDYLQKTAATVKDAQVQKVITDILANPAPSFVEPLVRDNAKQAVWDELKAGKLIDGVALEAFLPPVQDPKKSPQPFFSAPGSGYQSHHSYPGGLVTHTALNLKVSLALCEGYREIYGYELDRDVVIASQVLHDLHKPWVFQWNEDGASRTELTLAGTGEHHPFSVAESIYRGLPAEVCVAQACAHNHPGFPKDEAQPVNWIKAAGIIVGVDPKAKQLLDKSGETLPLPRRMENFVCHLGDHDWVLSVPAVKWLLPELQSIAVEKYKMTEQDLKGRKFNSLRNYVFSQATAIALYHLYCTKGKAGLTAAVTEVVTPA